MGVIVVTSRLKSSAKSVVCSDFIISRGMGYQHLCWGGGEVKNRKCAQSVAHINNGKSLR